MEILTARGLNALDDTCDLSAVLGILSNASVFSSAIQKLSKEVRQDVRNEWGHCNFNTWTAVKYSKSFQLMDSLLRALSLTPAEEKRITDELGDWETKGMQLCLGHIVDADLVKLIELEVSQLLGEVKLLEKNQQDETQRVTDALRIVQESIEEFKKDITKALKSLEESHENLNQKVDEIGDNTSAIAKDLKSMQDEQQNLRDDVSSTMISQEDLTRRVGNVEDKHECLDKRVQALESAIETKSTISENNAFQAPNRIPCFYGRVKELELLEKPLEVKAAPCNMSAICGLGGTGKTSLAIEHVWKTKDNYKGGVFWLSGESVSLFQNSMSEMARLIGTFDEDFNKTLSKTLYWLQTRKEYWCLVIDNLDEYDLKDSTEMLKLLCGHWKRCTAGHIIITTRREIKQIQEDIPDLASASCIELSNLSEHESVQFLKLRTEKPSDDGEYEVLSDLAAQLGYLPLALDQAAAYIKCTGTSFSHYLQQYKKQKLKTLIRYKAYYPAQDTSKERIAVHTTWELNFDYVSRLSEEYGIGQAAALIMEVSAFLCPDDIPLEIINEGLPLVENEDLHNCVSSPIGVTDILSILTKFSLFQTFTDKSLSVHRLVQEVIRSKMSKDRLKDVLQCASRMLHHAFANTNSPEEICKSFQGDSVFIQDNPPSLYLWGKLGAHASALQGHLLDGCKGDDDLRQHLIFTEETALLLNEASLYLSVCRQKVEALELQKTKLEVMTKLDEMSEEKLSHLNYFDIPLKNVQFKLLSHCMGHQESVPGSASSASETRTGQEEADKWREKGNDAFKNQEYQQAIDFYTVTLKYFNNDCRALCNRALCHLKMEQSEDALKDCESCLKLQKHNEKALRRKAWALFELSKTQRSLQGRATATAALVAHVDPTVLKEKSFIQMFPNLFKIEIFNSAQLVASFLYLIPGTTFLLHEGCYDLQGAMFDKDLQFVAVDDPVSLKFAGQGCIIMESNLYVEGIFLPKGSQAIQCLMNGSVTMYKCHISNGQRGCEDSPECNGGTGCVAAMYPGRDPCDRTGKIGDASVSGVAGNAGVQVLDHCTGYFEDCSIEGCGGGGILCHGDGSTVFVKSCKVHQNHQAGLEAREGGCLEAIDNDIYSNRYHGILIGPDAGACKIVDNRIYENSKEGILVRESLKHEVVIKRNKIYHNLPFGISLDRCQVHIQRNDIFENGFYGIHAKILTTATVENNDIYSNKCGGIHMGINFSGRVIITSNIVRDHSGPWLLKPEYGNSFFRNYKVRPNDPYIFIPDGETSLYSNPPFLKDNDLRKNYEEGIFHPKKKIELVHNECGFCHNTKNLLKCSRCNLASYCNAECQENHWNKHKSLCSALSDQYSVTVEFHSFPGTGIRTFGSHLKGIGKGPKPDPKSKRRFIVKIQTNHLNCHPLQLLTLYDRSTAVDGQIQSPQVFHIIMECGVLGEMSKFTSKKAFFYASFAERNGKKVKIDLAELAPYQEW
ncbi:hypothetical protein QZH41_014693 [Actinostola sp. cb2023]|nr:hypothetical protein QZH41_014693 [Actinostola sp. cb2023]